MNHQETPQTNPSAQWDPLDVSLNPLGLPAPPHRPLGPLKRSLGLIELKKSPQLHYLSSEDPSNFPVDPMGHLNPPP